MLFGLDTHIVCYLLDPGFAEHEQVSHLARSLTSQNTLALNPTVIHEAYHTLVYDVELVRQDARTRLTSLIRLPYVDFFNQTKSTSLLAMNLADKYELGGRDSLMLASYLGNDVYGVYTHDLDLVKIGQIDWRGRTMNISDPILGPKHK